VGKFSLFLFVAITGFTRVGLAQTELPLLGDPALLLDNARWLAAQNKFREPGSDTRAYLDLVTILYDWDNGRPWGKQYAPEATQRLNRFREKVCVDSPALQICQKPLLIDNAADVATAQAALVAPSQIALLEKRLQIRIAPWLLPVRAPIFSLIAARAMSEETISPAYWDLKPEKILVRTYEDEFMADAGNYLAGFENKDVAAMFTVNPDGLAVSDRQLRQRAVDFAAAWKHAIASNRKTKPEHPIASATDIQFQRLFDSNQAQFEKLYQELYKKVAALPEIRRRFESERAQGDYPGEVYQHAAFAQLADLARVQGAYFVLAHNQRKTSARQQALESLLTVQRYASSPQAFALELSTLLEPFASHAFVLDENADNSLAMTFVLENLRVILGLGHYANQALFPKYGVGLINPVLFEGQDLAQIAPEAAEALNGRDFATLDSAEQAEILRLYLEPVPGRVHSVNLIRLGTLFLSNSTAEELHTLAEAIEQRLQNERAVRLTELTTR
jgi:hypothetical protein